MNIFSRVKPPSIPSVELGPRRTRQRDRLVDLITQAEGPLTVGQLLEMANAGEGNVGIATVYRTVKLLLESGRIRSVTLPNGTVCYERSELGHHHHFHCHRCDRVFDLETCPVHIRKTDLPKGFTLDSHDITLTGVCAECGKSRATSDSRAATVPRRRIGV